MRFGRTKGEIRVEKGDFRVEKGDFRVIWVGFEGFGPCLGISHPTHPHLGEDPQKNIVFTPSINHCFKWPIVLIQNSSFTTKNILPEYLFKSEFWAVVHCIVPANTLKLTKVLFKYLNHYLFLPTKLLFSPRLCASLGTMPATLSNMMLSEFCDGRSNGRTGKAILGVGFQNLQSSWNLGY